ncbi:MAG: apolipoprotein N-acyltransferase [Simkaniaceae bacterium]|nr:apolipoprotein N-acyltransferase [Simkaniaceae bacterium]
MFRPIAFFLVSFLVVAWGQPDHGFFLSFSASGIGFACCFRALLCIKGTKGRFLWAGVWFAAVQGVQLFWMTGSEYQGYVRFFAYGGCVLFQGLQFASIFGLLSEKCIRKPYLLNFLAISGVWTLAEWGRLFVLCGFVWNPLGLTMTGSLLAAQSASVVGMFGLSFWVIMTNLFGLRMLALGTPRLRTVFPFLLVWLLPFAFGGMHVAYHTSRMKEETKRYRIALVQTALSPPVKATLSPYRQWEKIFAYLEGEVEGPVTHIILPECALPGSANRFCYPYEDVCAVLRNFKGMPDSTRLLIPSFAKYFPEREGGGWCVNNLFWSQVLADAYGAEVVVGLTDVEERGEVAYNAAFHLMPGGESACRYEKRILLPVAEYMPFPLLRSLASSFGISGFFMHGKETKVFDGEPPLTVSICYEDCFGHVIREGRKKGAELLVNVTNDGWYPSSGLHLKHFLHGKIRAIENGAPFVRACNTGVTSGMDALGRVTALFEGEDSETVRGTLVVSVNPYTYHTVYTYSGNGLIVTLSALCVTVALFRLASNRLRIYHADRLARGSASSRDPV